MANTKAGKAAVNTASKVLAAVFDNIDKIDANFFAYTRVDGKEDVLDLVYDDNGKFDPYMAEENTLLFEVQYELAPELKSDLIKAGVPFFWQSYIEPAKTEEDLAKPHTIILVPKSEEFIVNSVIEDFVKIKAEQDPMTPDALMTWIQLNDGDVHHVAGIEVDLELYDYISRAGLLNVPRTEVGFNEINNTVLLRTPWDMGEGVLATIKMAETLYTGNFRLMEEEREDRIKESLQKTVASAKDNLHNSIIVDATAPSHYIKLDNDEFRMYIDTAAGAHMIKRVNRSDRNFEQEFYNTLRSFGDYKEFVGKERDTEIQLRELQEKGQIIKGITAEERAHNLKREYIEHFMQACEIVGGIYERAGNMATIQRQAEKGRLLDDAHKIENRIDSLRAVGLGNSAQAGDLKGDATQIRGLVMSSVSSECIKDLSDLYSEPGWEKYLTVKLCLDAYQDKQKDSRLELFKDMVEAITKESKEVQDLFRSEFHETIKEVFEREYKFKAEEMKIEDIDLFLEVMVEEKHQEAQIQMTR